MKPLHSAHSPFVRNPSDFPFTHAGLFAVHRRPSLRHPWLRRRTLGAHSSPLDGRSGSRFNFVEPIQRRRSKNSRWPVSHPTPGGFNYRRQQWCTRWKVIEGWQFRGCVLQVIPYKTYLYFWVKFCKLQLKFKIKFCVALLSYNNILLRQNIQWYIFYYFATKYVVVENYNL